MTTTTNMFDSNPNKPGHIEYLLKKRATNIHDATEWLHWLPTKHRIDFKLANITFRTLHSSQPAYLRSSLHACHFTRSLRLSNTNNLLSAPFVRTSFGARSFRVADPKIWNSRPRSLRTCTSPDTFRSHLKTHYCQQAFQST